MVSINIFFHSYIELIFHSLPKSARQINQEQAQKQQQNIENNYPENSNLQSSDYYNNLQQQVSSIEQMSAAIDRIQINPQTSNTSRTRNNRSNNRRNRETPTDRRNNTTAQYSHYTHAHVEEISELTAANRRQKNEANRPRNQRRRNKNNNNDKTKNDDPIQKNNFEPKNNPEAKIPAEQLNSMKQKISEINSISPENLSQTDKLIKELHRQKYECLICYNNIKHHQAIWTCQTCYAMFHIFCIKKWAKNSLDQQANQNLAPSELPKWRCPGCQTETTQEPPKTYYCFCGKHKDPVHILGAIPHSCGQICGKKSKYCEHTCNNLCHPGQCPDCENYTIQTCPCDEANTRQIKCKNSINSIFKLQGGQSPV